MATMFNKIGNPKAGFTSATETCVIPGVGTTCFFDDIVVRTGPNLCFDAGAANALVATLTDIMAGTSIKPDVGTCVIVKTGNALQAGANTFNLNGHGTHSIVKQCSGSGAKNLQTIIAAGAMIMLIYDGTYWQFVGQ